MIVENLMKIIGADFYTGVPDSQLKALCNYLMATYGIDPKHHIIAANEGNCTALAAGYRPCGNCLREKYKEYMEDPEKYRAKFGIE